MDVLTSVLPNGSLAKISSHPNDYGQIGLLLHDPDKSRVFYKFPELPPELRETIWKFALPAPRFLKLSIPHGRDSHPEALLYWDDHGVSSHASSFLFTCRESNRIYHENYTRIKLYGASRCPRDKSGRNNFGDPVHYPFPTAEDISTFCTSMGESESDYIDYRRDTVFAPANMIEILSRNAMWLDLSFIEQLAITFNGHIDLRHAWEFAAQCRNLKSLTVFVGKVDTDSWLTKKLSRSLSLEADPGPRAICIGDRLLYIATKDAPVVSRHASLALANSERLSTPEREWLLSGLCREAMLIKPLLKQYAADAPEDWSNLTISIAILGYGSHKWEKVFLIPKKPQYSGVAYYKWKRLSTDKSPMIASDILEWEILFYEDGTIQGLYDGIPKLFGED